MWGSTKYADLQSRDRRPALGVFAAGARRRSGITILELMVAISIVGVIVVMAIPASNRSVSNRRLFDSASTISQLLSYGRGQAISTGNIHIVFLDHDAEGNALVDANGDSVDVLVLDDGRPGASDQNCKIDAGEETVTRTLETGVSFGVTAASAKVGIDGGSGAIGTGSTFADASSGQAYWVLFRPEGTPLGFSADCTMGSVGSGSGAAYITNGTRDAAAVLTPLGISRVHSYRPDNSGWSS